jgi:hypothetical protein
MYYTTRVPFTDMTHTDVDLDPMSTSSSAYSRSQLCRVLQDNSNGAWILETIKMVGTHMLGFHPTASGTTRIVVKEILIMMRMSLRYHACSFSKQLTIIIARARFQR